MAFGHLPPMGNKRISKLLLNTNNNKNCPNYIIGEEFNENKIFQLKKKRQLSIKTF
jgi:hypothetical protein